jgi:hypothetical protein
MRFPTDATSWWHAHHSRGGRTFECSPPEISAVEVPAGEFAGLFDRGSLESWLLPTRSETLSTVSHPSLLIFRLGQPSNHSALAT